MRRVRFLQAGFVMPEVERHKSKMTVVQQKRIREVFEAAQKIYDGGKLGSLYEGEKERYEAEKERYEAEVLSEGRLLSFAERLSEALGISVAKMAVLSSYLVSKRPTIVMPPGTGAMTILGFFFSKKAMNSVFVQLIADMRQEHAEALQAGRISRARWVVLREHLNLVVTACAYVAATFGKTVLSIWKVIL